MTDLPPHDEACAIAGCLPSCPRRAAKLTAEVEALRRRPLPLCRFCGKNDGDDVLVIGDTCTDCARTWS